MSDTMREELIKLQAQAYDKGFNDALNGVIESFKHLKTVPITQVLPIDTVIHMLEQVQIEGNKVPTTYDKWTLLKED